MAESRQSHPDVSFDSEELILVDSEDNPTGHADKGSCHDGQGVLHRAFSLFIFNRDGEVLLQQRAAGKRLWPGYWANSCCSHPRYGETMEQATERRLLEELGMRSKLHYLFKFEYQAHYLDLGTEHELCWVYHGTSDDPVKVNSKEVSAWRFVAPADLDVEIADHPERFTPWLKLEWSRVRTALAEKTPD